jgi:peptide-methionine (R)-S-oxide reductase
VNERQIAWGLGLGRVGIGLAILAAPERVARGWVGDDGGRTSVRVMIRGLGGRDLALGAGLVAALRTGDPVGRWLWAGVAADGADMAGTLAARDALPATARAGILALAGGAAVVGARLARSLV